MDAIALALSALQVTLVLALLFLVPGIALGPLLVPGATSPLARLGRAAGVSLLTTAATCTLLAGVGLLRPPIVLAVLAGMTVVAFAIRRPAIPLRIRPRSRRWRAGALAGAVLAVAVVIVPSHLALGPNLLPVGSTVWYYAYLALSVARAGGFPATVSEWGADRPFQGDYLPVTAHTAAALQWLPGDLPVQLELYRLALLAAAVVVAALLFRRWTSSWIAFLGAVLLLSTLRMEAKFLGYRPETFALVLALFTLWVADRAFVERSRRLRLTAMFGAAMVFLAHAEVFLVFAPALVGLAIARSVVRPGRGRLGLRRPLRRHLVPVGLAALALVAGLAGAVVVSAGLTGHLRLLGYATGGAPTGSGPPAGPIGERPPDWAPSGDPTWDFYTAAVAPALAGTEPPRSFTDARFLTRTIVHVWAGLDGRMRSGLAVLVLLVAAAFAAWPVLDARRRRMLLGWAVFAVGLALGSYVLFSISDTYVPMRIGPRRLMPYELFVPVVAAVLLLWALDRLLRPGWRALLPRRGAMLAAGVALAALAVGAISAAPPRDDGASDEPEPALSRVGYDAYRTLALELPSDARILANTYTDGALAAVAGRPGIIDGRAPFLEDRAFLQETTGLVLSARAFFLAPDSTASVAFLARERVGYLLVGTAGPFATDLGGYVLFATNIDILRRSDRYTLARSFGDGRLLLFRVNPPG